MRLAPLLLACLLGVVGLAGCSDKEEDPAQTRADCTDEQWYNAFEQRCVSRFEVCHAWLKGQADAGEEEVVCQVDSDGDAWLDWGFGLTGTIHVTVTDGEGQVVYENNIGNGHDRARVRGADGAWRLAVDFGTATGTGEVYLWG